MDFWIFMLVINLLIPATMIGFGAYFRKRAPGKINAIFGYRTTRSMASRAAWDFAHRLFGRIWLWGGVLLLPLTVAASLPLLDASEKTVGIWGGAICMGQLLIMLVCIIPVEVALHRAFFKNGERKQP